MSEDAWKEYEEKKIRDGFAAYHQSEQYASRVIEARRRGYLPATLHECLYAAPNELFSWAGGLWTKECAQ